MYYKECCRSPIWLGSEIKVKSTWNLWRILRFHFLRRWSIFCTVYDVKVITYALDRQFELCVKCQCQIYIKNRLYGFLYKLIVHVWRRISIYSLTETCRYSERLICVIVMVFGSNVKVKILKYGLVKQISLKSLGEGGTCLLINCLWWLYVNICFRLLI